MGKTYSTDAAHQKRHFVRINKDRYADEVKCAEGNTIAVIERSFQVDAIRYGNPRKGQARAKVEDRRSNRRTVRHSMKKDRDYDE